ncbi:MAG: glutathione S-transferase [Betaproteobacteria bacterium]|nr:glutathione S-transferase [Betaproteobacteria bacterium]
MLELYTAGTHNGIRANIALAESGLSYTVHKLNLSAGDQRQPDYLEVNPAGRIPALVDPQGPGGATRISQSGAIMIYAANKSGKMWPSSDAGKIAALQWLMFACTDAAPWSGVYNQAMNMMPEKVDANIEYCKQRLLRWFGEADAQLGKTEYLAGEISLADYAAYPVINQRKALVEEAGMKNLLRWWSKVGNRAGVQKGMSEST